MDRAIKIRISIFTFTILLAIVFFGSALKTIIICATFMLIGAASTQYKRFIHIPIHFELVKLGTILTAIVFGPIVGTIVGLIGGLSGKILSGRVEPDIFGTIVATVAIAIAAAFFHDANILALGIGLTLLYHLITAPIALLTGQHLGAVLMKTITNTIFNAFVFGAVGGILLTLIS